MGAETQDHPPRHPLCGAGWWLYQVGVFVCTSCVCLCVNTCVSVFMCVYVHVHTRVSVCVCVCTYTPVCVYLYVHTCVAVHSDVQQVQDITEPIQGLPQPRVRLLHLGETAPGVQVTSRGITGRGPGHPTPPPHPYCLAPEDENDPVVKNGQHHEADPSVVPVSGGVQGPVLGGSSVPGGHRDLGSLHPSLSSLCPMLSPGCQWL